MVKLNYFCTCQHAPLTNQLQTAVSTTTTMARTACLRAPKQLANHVRRSSSQLVKVLDDPATTKKVFAKLKVIGRNYKTYVKYAGGTGVRPFVSPVKKWLHLGSGQYTIFYFIFCPGKKVFSKTGLRTVYKAIY